MLSAPSPLSFSLENGSVACRPRLRVLWLNGFAPLTFYGAGLRCHHLLLHLAAQHDVTLAITGERQDLAEDLSSALAQTLFFPLDHTESGAKRASVLSGLSALELSSASSALQRWLDESAARFDVIVVDHTRLAALRLPATAPAILNLHNLEHELAWRTARHDHHLLRAAFRTVESLKLRRREHHLRERFAAVTTCSDRETAVVRSYRGTARVETIPNGVALPERDAAAERPFEFLFVGTMNYYPNMEAVTHFAGEIWPAIRRSRPEARLRVVGVNPPASVRALAGDGIEVTGGVPEVAPYYRTSKVFVVPLLSGSGTRLKILEAAGHGLPIVSTSIGAEGLEFEDGREIALADTPEAFARACLRLLDQPEEARAMGEAAHARVEADYQWKSIAARYEALLRDVHTHHLVGGADER